MADMDATIFTLPRLKIFHGTIL